MNNKLQAGIAASVLLISLAATVQAAPVVTVEKKMSQHTTVSDMGTKSFDSRVSELRRVISEREKSGVITSERAAKLNHMLDRATVARSQYIAQGRKLTPEQQNKLRSRLDNVRIAVRERLQNY